MLAERTPSVHREATQRLLLAQARLAHLLAADREIEATEQVHEMARAMDSTRALTGGSVGEGWCSALTDARGRAWALGYRRQGQVARITPHTPGAPMTLPPPGIGGYPVEELEALVKDGRSWGATFPWSSGGSAWLWVQTARRDAPEHSGPPPAPGQVPLPVDVVLLTPDPKQPHVARETLRARVRRGTRRPGWRGFSGVPGFTEVASDERGQLQELLALVGRVVTGWPSNRRSAEIEIQEIRSIGAPNPLALLDALSSADLRRALLGESS